MGRYKIRKAKPGETPGYYTREQMAMRKFVSGGMQEEETPEINLAQVVSSLSSEFVNALMNDPDPENADIRPLMSQKAAELQQMNLDPSAIQSIVNGAGKQALQTVANYLSEDENEDTETTAGNDTGAVTAETDEESTNDYGYYDDSTASDSGEDDDMINDMLMSSSALEGNSPDDYKAFKDVAKYGGTNGKRKFIRETMSRLSKAAEGMEQQSKNTASLRGTADDIKGNYLTSKETFVPAVKQNAQNTVNKKFAEQQYESMMNQEFQFGGANRRLRRANKAMFGTPYAPPGINTDYKFGLLGGLRSASVSWDPSMMQGMFGSGSVMPGMMQSYSGGWYTPTYKIKGTRVKSASEDVSAIGAKAVNSAALDKVAKDTPNSDATSEDKNLGQIGADAAKNSGLDAANPNSGSTPGTANAELNQGTAGDGTSNSQRENVIQPKKKKDAWGRSEGDEWYGFNPATKQWTLGAPDWYNQKKDQNKNTKSGKGRWEDVTLKKDDWGRTERESIWYGFDPKTKKWVAGPNKGKSVNDPGMQRLINALTGSATRGEYQDWLKENAKLPWYESLYNVVAGEFTGDKPKNPYVGGLDEDDPRTYFLPMGINAPKAIDLTIKGSKLLGPGRNALNSGQQMLNQGQGMLNQGQGMLNQGQGMLNQGQKLLNPPEGYQFTLPFQVGGGINNPVPNQYGNLQKFFYGGDDVDQYDMDFDNSKDVSDAYFRNGGLYRFQGEDDSEVEGGQNAGLTKEDVQKMFEEYSKKQNPQYNQQQYYNEQQYYPGSFGSAGAGQPMWGRPSYAPGYSGRMGQYGNLFGVMTKDFDYYTPYGGGKQGKVAVDPMQAYGASLANIQKSGMIPTGIKYSKEKKQDGNWFERKLGFNKDRVTTIDYARPGTMGQGQQSNDLDNNGIPDNIQSNPLDPKLANKQGQTSGVNQPTGTTPNQTQGSNIYSNTEGLSNKAQRQIRRGERRTAREVGRGMQEFPEGQSGQSNNISPEVMKQAVITGCFGGNCNDGSKQQLNKPAHSFSGISSVYEPEPTTQTSYNAPAYNSLYPKGTSSSSGISSVYEPGMAYGGYMPAFAFQYGGDMPEYQIAGEINNQINPMGDYTPDWVKNPLDPKLYANAPEDECTDEEKQNPASPCYEKDTEQIKLKKETAKTFHPDRLANTLKAGASAFVTNMDQLQGFKNNYVPGMQNLAYANQPSRQRIETGPWEENSGTFNKMGFEGIVKKGGTTGLKENGEYQLTMDQIREILKAGGKVKFL